VIDPLIDPSSRAEALKTLYARLRFGQSCAVTGLNDVGKTTLLSLARSRDALVRFAPCELIERVLFVHVDCNLLSGSDERELFALIARAARDAARGAGLSLNTEAVPDVSREDSQSLFAAVALESLLGALVAAQRIVVTLFDEFDALYARLDARAVLALRAFDNRVGPALAYVVATDRPLRSIRAGGESHSGDTAEFEDMFIGGAIPLGPLVRDEAEAFVRRYVESRQLATPSWLPSLIAEQAGGHPGLLWACCAAAARLPSESMHVAREALRASPEVEAECEAIVRRLQDPNGGDRAALDPFPLLRRSGSTGLQRAIRESRGVRLDPTTGEVTINSVPVSASLGPTEYRLLTTLASRSGALVSKDEIARALWPDEEHMGGVDDARIDKLIDRVRTKIEPDAKRPRYLVTVRGLGYRLLPGDA